MTIGNPKRQEIGALVDGPIVVADRSLVMLAEESKFHILDLSSGSAVVQQLDGNVITQLESLRRDAPIVKLNGGNVLAYVDTDKIRELKNEGTANDVVVSSKNDLFVSASTDKIVVRDVQTNKVIAETSTMHNTGTVKNVFTQLYRKKSDSTPRFRFLVTTRDGTNIMVSGRAVRPSGSRRVVLPVCKKFSLRIVPMFRQKC